MESLRAEVAQIFHQLGQAPGDNQVKLLERARQLLVSSAEIFQEFLGELEKLVENGNEEAQSWVCTLHRSVSKSNTCVPIFVSGFEVSTVLVTVPGVTVDALLTIDSIIKATYEEGKLLYKDAKLWRAFHAAADAVRDALHTGKTRSAVSGLQLLKKCMLVYSSPVSSSLGLSATEIAAKLQGLLKELLDCLKAAKAEKQPSTVTLAATQAAADLVLSRPGQAGRILPTLLSAAGSLALSRTLAAPSIQKCLKRALWLLVSQSIPALQSWKPKIAEALAKLGVVVPPEIIPAKGTGRQQNRAAGPRQATPSLQAPSLPPPHAQATAGPVDPRLQPHNESPAQAPVTAGPSDPRLFPQGNSQSQGNALPQDPRLQQQSTSYPQQLLNYAAQYPNKQPTYPQQVLSYAAQNPQSTLQNPGSHQPIPVPTAPAADEITPAAEIHQILAVVAALVAENDYGTCLAFVNGLSPAVLADAVIAKMADLPRKEDIAESNSNDSTSQRSGNALLAGLMQATTQTNEQQDKSASQPTIHMQDSQNKSEVPARGGGANGTLPRKTKPAPKPAPAVTIKLHPPTLDTKERAVLRKAALQRLIRATTQPCQNLRLSLLSHTAGAEEGSQWPEGILETLGDNPGREAYELVLKTLCTIFAATSKPLPEPKTDPTKEGDGALSNSQMSQGVAVSAVYTSRLESLISHIRAKLPAKDRILARLLVDVPALPNAILENLLRSLVEEDAEHATLSLIAARDVVMLRPANRPQALDSMLGMAVALDEGIRAKAVRLIANKLLPEIMLTAPIEAFATKELRKLTCVRPAKRQKLDNSESHLATAESENLKGRVAIDQNDADEVSEGRALKRQRSDNEVDIQADAAPVIEAAIDENGNENKRQKLEEKQSQRSSLEDESRMNGSNGQINDKLQGNGNGNLSIGQDAAASPRGGLQQDAQANGKNETLSTDTPKTAARHCELYCALCTKHHALLRDLFVVFGECKGLGRAAIMRNAEGLARVLGASAPALIALIDDTPQGSTNLLLRMLNFLTERQIPPQVMVDACKRKYDSTADPNLLIPALAGLTHEEILAALPKLLDPLPLFGAALARILLPHASGESRLTPTGILLALHSIDPSKTGVKMKTIMVALDECVSRRDIFGKAVLASALQQLNQRATLPPLYMRFLMQSHAAVPELKSFMIEQLAALVSRQIWTNKVLFTGWLLAVRQNVPDAFPAFLQLPTRILTESLQSVPHDFREKLRDYANSASCPGNQRNPILKVLDSASKEVK